MDAAKQRLGEILESSGWTQEQLAYQLGVSFATVNAWLNGRAVPRGKHMLLINDLYLGIVGREEVSEEFLDNARELAYDKKMTVDEILDNQKMLDALVLNWTYHTNTIEGSTMTMDDVKAVLSDRVLVNKTAIEQAEARNHRAALYYLLDLLREEGEGFKWTEEIILQTHLRLMNTIITNAGQYRNYGVRIMGAPVGLANYMKIPELMRDLVEDLNDAQGDLLSDMARLHARFEKIHPFGDGNGRTGRLILMIQALKAGITPPIIVKERREAYYKAVFRAQVDGDITLLTAFMAEGVLAGNSILNK